MRSREYRKKELMATMFQSFLKERIARLEREVRLAGPRANGCGSEGSLIPVPDRPFGINFKPACESHDKNYARLSRTREVADQVFLLDLLAICRRTFLNEKFNVAERASYIGCVHLAITYYHAVRLFGKDAYDKAQVQARENNWK